MTTSARHRRRLLPVVVGLLALLGACKLPPLPPPAPGSALIGCERAGERVQVTATSHLDPSCTYTAGFDISTSGVTLDCQGATIAGTAGGTGILISSPVETAMDHVTVRNCRVQGFVNSIRVTRPGFRFLVDDHEFEHPLSDIVIEDNHVSGSRGVGIYVDGYVSGVTIRRNEVNGAGSSGIYLETGSKQTRVERNVIANNGYIENGTAGKLFEKSGIKFWFWGVGREGISIDGSYENTIVGNAFSGNSAGGVFLYKNCGEYPDRNPDRYFERRDPSIDNLIEANLFIGGRNGVWIGSRMGENTYPMECSDPAYVDQGVVRVVLDHAAHNTVRANLFHDVTYGVRVEDDDNTVTANTFSATTADRHAVIVGTPYRTDVLHRPVSGTVVTDNMSTIPGNTDPYRWVHGETATTVSGNTALGAPVGICEGQPLPRQVFVMVIAIAVALPDGSAPPTPDLTVATLGPLPPCSAGSTTTATPGPSGT